MPWQRLLRHRKKKVGLIICNSIPTIRCKDCESQSSGSWDTSAPSEQVPYNTKLVAMATSLKESEKNWTRSRKFTQISSIWWKDRESRSSRYWDNLAHSKKEEINASKTLALPASLPSGLNKEITVASLLVRLNNAVVDSRLYPFPNYAIFLGTDLQGKHFVHLYFSCSRSPVANAWQSVAGCWLGSEDPEIFLSSRHISHR